MTDTAESLRRKIDGAAELQSVVRTLKTIAAASINQYERAVHALDDYYHTVELGLSACLRQIPLENAAQTGGIGAVVFGSDQGLVGQFNDTLANFVLATLNPLPEAKQIWTVGERVESYLAEAGLPLAGGFNVPNSINAVTNLVARILVEIEAVRSTGKITQVYLFHNRPQAGAAYQPSVQRLLPLDDTWQTKLLTVPWPSKNLAQVMDQGEVTLHALIREYLFISLFRACVESLASENASRLAAMQRAEKNIDELLDELKQTFHRLRQSSIDEELFDVVAGYELLFKK